MYRRLADTTRRDPANSSGRRYLSAVLRGSSAANSAATAAGTTTRTDCVREVCGPFFYLAT